MAINQCAPCSDPCYQSAAANSKYSFYSAVLNILCSMYQGSFPTTVGRINGNYTGANQTFVAAQGAGKVIRVRSLLVGTEDANTDWQVFSRSAGNVNTALTPNYDYLSNAGMVGVNPDGWFESLPNEALVITTSGGAVDLLGTYIVRG